MANYLNVKKLFKKLEIHLGIQYPNVQGLIWPKQIPKSKLGQIIWLINIILKIFGICFIIWYPSRIGTGQPICFVQKNKPFLKSNSGHFPTCILHYLKWTKKLIIIICLNQLFWSKPNYLFVWICQYLTLFDFLRRIMINYSFGFVLWFESPFLIHFNLF